MKAILVGYEETMKNVYQDDKPTGQKVRAVRLFFLREPKFSENVFGQVAEHPTVKGDDSIAKLPPLEIGSEYDCEFSSYKGIDTLSDIRALN